MPVQRSSKNYDLYNELQNRGFDPVPLDHKGNTEIDIPDADVFRFEYKVDGENYGPGWASIADNDLVLYYDDKLFKAPKFTEFLKFMKSLAMQTIGNWVPTNSQHLSSDMKKRGIMKKKEQLGEGYHPMGKKASYNDSVPQVKIILQHTRQIEEGEQRFRNIERIFVENTNGERFLVPTKRPGLARVYARHVAEGGTPYDERGTHITTLVEEYTKMAGFVRATKNGQFNESAQKLVNEGLNHYSNLRETLTRMISHRGYNTYFESYTPVLNEEADDETSLNELFVQETLDPRIESVLPILKRLNKNISEMSEVKELDEWAQSILEVEDETTKTLAEPAEEMLDERNIENKKMKNRVASRVGASTDLYGKDAGVDKYDHQPNFTTATHSKEVGRSVMKDPKISSSQVSKLLNKNSDPDMFSDIKEAPGAETLAHNQSTEKSNLAAFDLAEDDMQEGVKNVYKSVRKKFRQSAIGRAREYGYSIEEGFSASDEVADQIEDSLGGTGRLTSDDLYRAVEEYQQMMDNPHKLDVDEVVQILMDRFHSKGIMVPDIGESTVNELSPKTKSDYAAAAKKDKEFNQRGIDQALDRAARNAAPGRDEWEDEAEFFKSVNAKRDRGLKRAGAEVDEGLDSNQKAAGQLGPTEKVGPKGAVGKLVGANESAELDAIKKLSGI